MKFAQVIVDTAQNLENTVIPDGFIVKEAGSNIFRLGTGVAYKNLQKNPAFYEHVQTTAAKVWNVQHNLGFKQVGVWLYDTTGQEIHGEIDGVASTANLLVVRFGITTAGRAFARGR
jgi:hypothetical protein